MDAPNSFIFMEFSAKNLQSNRLVHPLWELAPPSGKSLMHHCRGLHITVFLQRYILMTKRFDNFFVLENFSWAVQDSPQEESPTLQTDDKI